LWHFVRIIGIGSYNTELIQIKFTATSAQNLNFYTDSNGILLIFPAEIPNRELAGQQGLADGEASLEERLEP